MKVHELVNILRPKAKNIEERDGYVWADEEKMFQVTLVENQDELRKEWFIDEIIRNLEEKRKVSDYISIDEIVATLHLSQSKPVFIWVQEKEIQSVNGHVDVLTLIDFIQHDKEVQDLIYKKRKGK